MPQYVYATQIQLAECVAYGDSGWAGDRETRRSTAAVLEKLGNHGIESVSCSQTAIALSSGVAEFYALQRAAAGAGALQTQRISTGWGRPVRAIVRSDGAAGDPVRANCGISESKSPGFMQARKLVVKKVGTDDNFAYVGTKYNEDGKKLVHLLSLSGLRMKMGLGLTALNVATVALQGCASIVHVEGTVTASTAAVTEMVIAVATEWLVGGG